jgi:hypothetical protein
MQELTAPSKKTNLRITGIAEGEQMHAKGIGNIFNKIITENFPSLKKVLPIQVQETYRETNRLTKRECPVAYNH